MVKYSKLSQYRVRRIFSSFFEGYTATQTASILGINRNTANLWYGRFRKAAAAVSGWVPERGSFEVDESYFGPKRVRGKRGRGAGRKVPVFGVLKRGGKVHVEIVRNCSRKSLLPVLKGKILEGSTVHSDGWGSYDGLVTMGYRHYRIHHSKDEFARGKNHVNGIESFWSFCKRRMAKMNGIRKTHFHLHLKECEFRYNWRNEKDAWKKISKNLLV